MSKEKLDLDFTRSEYEHITQRKTRLQMVMICACICGVDFCYAANLAYANPVLLQLELNESMISWIRSISALIGFFTLPLLGSMSDNCRSKLGRRRPFILFFSFGIVLGIILIVMGTSMSKRLSNIQDIKTAFIYNQSQMDLVNITTAVGSRSSESEIDVSDTTTTHLTIILLTVIGVILMDVCSDSCQSPSRAFMIDITLPEDQAAGLSTFTIVAGVGGVAGFVVCGVDWGGDSFPFNTKVKIVFLTTMVIVVVGCLITVCSFKEVPLDFMECRKCEKRNPCSEHNIKKGLPSVGGDGDVNTKHKMPESELSLRSYLRSIIFMPRRLRILCLVNLFCWISLVCFGLFFTDFVGQAVYHGDPHAPGSSFSYQRYQDGVKIGSYCLVLYCGCYFVYSYLIDKLIDKFGVKKMYYFALILYSASLVVLIFWQSIIAAAVVATLAGLIYTSVFSLPYILLTHYYNTDTLEESPLVRKQQVRGMGTDVAVVTSMMFLAQFLICSILGYIMQTLRSTMPVMYCCLVSALCAIVFVSQVYYEKPSDIQDSTQKPKEGNN